MTHEPPTPPEAPLPVRAQILSTEHWSLLATRSLAWSESFSRATWFVTVVSAALVALALVANSSDFGREFRLLALLMLPLLVVVGVATVIRLADLNREDVNLVIAMNRLRRGYLDLAPELEQYFTTGHTEDVAGVMQTYGARRTRVPALQHALSIALLVGVIVAVLVGALAGLVADTADLGSGAAVATGSVTGAVALAAITVLLVQQVRRTWPVRDLAGARVSSVPGVEIRTARLRLTPLRAADAPELVGVLDDPRLHEFVGGAPASLEELRARYASWEGQRSPDGREEWLNWVIRVDGGTPIGTVQATVSAAGSEASVAWVVGSAWQGHGYASEAAVALVAWLEQRGVGVVRAFVHPEHHASRAVARHAGLAPTGRYADGEEEWLR